MGWRETEAIRPTSKRPELIRLGMTRKQIPGALICAVAFVVPLIALADTDQPTPHEIIESASSSMAEQLDGHRDYYEANLDELYSLIDAVLLPHFDTRYAGRLVMGNHWKSASSDQRTEFVEAFYDFLLRSYAKGVLQFDQNRIEILPSGGELKEKRAVVKTQMRLDDGTIVPVNYSLRRSSTGWRVYDIRIEGISYVQNYRNQFNAEIRANGVDSVIARLREESDVVEINN
jgi:phospholipid transport system substrate-binding protein